MPRRFGLSPSTKFNLICVSLATATALEVAGLWALSSRQPPPTPQVAAVLPTPFPTRAPAVFTAPGVAEPTTAAPLEPALEPSLAAPLSPALTAPKTLTKPAFAVPKGAKTDPKTARAAQLFDAGAAALKAGDGAKALASFQAIVPLAPNDFATRFNLSLLYLAAKQPEKARPHLEKAVALQPKNAGAQFQLARALLALKKPALALVPLEKAVKFAPKERAARLLLAQVLLDSKRPREAYAQWTTLANADARDIAAQLQAAALANDVLKRPAEAQKWLQRAIAANPRDTQAALLLGRLQLSERRFKAAAATLGAAAKNRPDAFEIYPLLADARVSSGDTKGAIDALQSAILRVPVGQNAREKAASARVEGGLQLTLGRLLGNTKQPAAAAKAFARAAQLLPDDPEIASLQALAQLQLKKPAAAVALLQTSLQRDPKRDGDRFLLVQVLAAQKEWKKADAQLEIYLKNQPRDGEALLLGAQIGRSMKDPSRELAALTRLSFLAPKNPRVWAMLGSAQLEYKQKNAALGSFQTLVKLAPQSGDAQFELARLQSELGDDQGAFVSWQAVLKARPDTTDGYASLLQSGEKSGQSMAARTFCARAVAAKPENLKALSAVLAFYEKRGQVGQAKAFLADVVARNPKHSAAKKALDSFAGAASGAVNATGAPTTTPAAP